MSAETKPLRFLRLPNVEHKVGLKKTCIYGLMAKKEFPAAVKLTDSTNVWIEQEIDDWMQSRIDASRAGIHTGDHPTESGGQSGGPPKRRADLRAVQS